MTETIKEPTLDERIAAALTGEEQLASSFISDLISETETAISAADEIARLNRERAYDPTILDPVARGKSDDATFVAHRLRAGLERLKEAHREATLRERLVEWHSQCDVVEAKRDALSAELAERWPTLCAWAADILARIKICNRETDEINQSAVGYEGRRLLDVECHARGLSGWMSSDVRLVEKVKLPELVIGRHGAIDAWPPRQQPIGVQLMSPIFGTRDPQLNGGPQPEYYKMVDGEARGVFADGSLTPPNRPPQPSTVPTPTMQEQIHADQQARAEDSAKLARDTAERERGRLAKNAEEAARAKEYESERRRLAAGRLPEPDAR